MTSSPWKLRELEDKDEIYSFLQRDRFYTAYAIADLEHDLFPYTQWVGAERDGRLVSLVLLFTRIEPPALLAVGDPEGIRMILKWKLRPEQAILTFRDEHRPAIQGIYRLTDAKRMLRMVFDPDCFSPPRIRAERLNIENLDELEEFYREATETGVVTAFSAYQVEQGVFYGIRFQGKLVSVAGTHVVSPTYRIAAVGNVFTHPLYRGRGYASACTGAVVSELLRRGIDAVLNVGKDNAVAIGIYKRLGFKMHCEIIEAQGTRV